jgi:hypothetical protein
MSSVSSYDDKEHDGGWGRDSKEMQISIPSNLNIEFDQVPTCSNTKQRKTYNLNYNYPLSCIR